MQNNNWEPFGVEISDFASSYAREKFGLNVFTGELLQKRFSNEYFNVVTMYAVLEHLPNPRQILTEITRILKPNGLLVITTQNIGSIEARIFKEKWYHPDAPRHLYDFSERTLIMILEKTGYKILKLNFFSAGGIINSLRYLAEEVRLPRKKNGISWVDKIFSKVINLSFLLISIYIEIICFVIYRLMAGGEAIEVYAKLVKSNRSSLNKNTDNGRETT